MSLSPYRVVALLLVAVIAGISVAVVAVHDHRRSYTRIQDAELAEWYCKNKGRLCGGPDSDRMHEAWERRERVYKLTESTLGAAIVVGAGLFLFRRRTSR